MTCPVPSELKQRNIALRARQAEAVYWEDEDSASYLRDTGYRDVWHVDHEGQQAYVATKGPETLVVIRGTDELVDWARNLRGLFKRRYSAQRPEAGRVHRGFLEAADAIELPIRWRVDDLGTPRLVLVGHSLGAAVASLIAPWLRPHEVFLFGCPRAGDRRFARWYNVEQQLGHRTLNVRNGADIVPLLPTWNHEVGRRFHVRAGRVYRDPPLWRRALFQGSAVARWMIARTLGNPATVGSVTDHLPSSYVDSMEMIR